MSYTIKEAVFVDIRVNGEDLSKSYEPGTTELPEAVANVLVAQGIAVESTAKSKTSKPVTESTEINASEA